MKRLLSMNRDTTPNLMQEGEWVDAQNVVMTDKRGSIGNEEAYVRYGCTEDGFNIIGIIPLPNSYFQFSTKVLGALDYDCKIDYIDEAGVCTCVILDPSLHFSVLQPIQGTYDINFKGEITIVFWEDMADSANPPRMLNKSCLPFEVDGNCALVDPTAIVMLQQFPLVNCIDIDLDGVIDNAGTLKSGVYYISVAYAFADGSRANFSENSNPVTIVDATTNARFETYDGDESDTQTSKAIQFTISNIDTNFVRLAIAITSKIGGVVTTKLIEDIVINGTSLSYIYTGEQGFAFDTVELITPKASFTRVFAGTNYNNKLYYGQVKTLAKPNIQPYINSIKAEWIATKDMMLNTIEGSYKNPNNIFYFRTYRTNAVYAFYMIAHMNDGTSYAYPITNREPAQITVGGITFAENALISDLVTAGIIGVDTATPLSVNPNARWHQFFDTSLNDGTLGYWENVDELYPDLDCMDIKNSIGTITGTLRNQTVKHLKMPSITALNTHLGADISNTSSVVNLLYDANIGAWSGGGSGGTALHVPVTDNTAGVATVGGTGNTEFTFLVATTVHIDVVYTLSDIDGNVNFIIKVLKFDGSFTHYVSESVNVGGVFNPIDNYTFDFKGDIPVEVGDKLFIQLLADGGGVFGDSPNFNIPSKLKMYRQEFANVPIDRKILGIKITNFNVPDNLEEDVICYELGYAERTGVNNNVNDQAPVIKKGTQHAIAHPFDSLNTKQNLTVDYMERHYIYNNVTTEATPQFIYSDKTAANSLLKVVEATYVPENVTVPINNEYKEENLHLQTEVTIPDDYALYDFLTYRTNLYLGLFTNNIVKTGHTIAKNVTTTSDIYGGDSFVSLYGIITAYQAFLAGDGSTGEDININITYQKFITEVESFANLNLRHSDIHQFYLPYNDGYDNDANEFDQSADDFNAKVRFELSQYSNGLLYNHDYSSVNNLFPILVATCDEECSDNQTIVELPFRIVRSLINNRNQYRTNWRTFLLNDYFEMPTNKGVIYTLKTYSRTLVIQMKNSLFMAVDRNTLEVNNITVALGKGDIFDVIPDEQIADDGGYIGCCDRWASFVCKLGYVVVDAVNFDRGKIILYNGKVNEISAIKMFNHFRDHTHIIAKEEDNPFRLQGWSGAYDEKFNRLVFSKKNARDVRNNRFENIGISYSQEANGGQGGWVSFHSANANTLFHNRQGIFSVFNFNLQVNGVFKQNFNDLYGEYFTATSKEKSYIDFVFNRGGSTVMMLNNITWQLVSYLGSDKDSEFEHGLTSIMVYTNNQCSGEIALVATSNLIPSPNMVRYVEGIFQFDGFRDLAIDPNIRSVSDTGVLVTSNIATTKPWYDKGRFINTFFFVRATYDNVSNRNVNIEVLEVNVQKSNR